MSWLVSMMRFPEGIYSIGELPRDFVHEPLGTHAEVVTFIHSLFPTADYSCPDWISCDSERVSEISIPNEDPVLSVGFRNPSLELLQTVFDAVGWRGIDPSDGQIIPPFEGYPALTRP